MGLSDERWRTLLYLAHTDKKKAFRGYADYYRSTDGQLYWSDTHQMSFYPENYHHEIDRIEHASTPASEIITEFNVPREQLESFVAEVRNDFRKNNVNLTYGTVRMIEKDDEIFAKFLSLKRKYDPEERFQSHWYRHYRAMFEEAP